MKRQLLFLVLAFFAITGVYGQATHKTEISTVSCQGDPLHPIAGKEYLYKITTDPTGGTYTWWATASSTPSFISGGALQNTSANVLGLTSVVPGKAANYNAPISNDTIHLTWTTAAVAAATTGTTPTPTFVAVNYNAPSGSCANNLKVYQVEPINAFVVDITNIKHDDKSSLDYNTAESQCFANVQSASWSGDKMVYDYGTNVLYFEVIAANFTGSWTPSFKLTGLQTGQKADIVWDYSTTFDSPVSIGTDVPNGSYTSSTAATTNLTDTSKGVSIFVKVTIHNNTWEGTESEPISLAVDGKNSADQSDVDNDDCSKSTAYSDIAEQTLTLRPTITTATTGGDFEQP